ncbi:unnamed protein product, partial [Didymodactylos carnosus]
MVSTPQSHYIHS